MMTELDTLGSGRFIVEVEGGVVGWASLTSLALHFQMRCWHSVTPWTSHPEEVALELGLGVGLEHFLERRSGDRTLRVRVRVRRVLDVCRG